MLYASRHPQRVYAGYRQVPPLVVDMLVFIENREQRPQHDPTGGADPLGEPAVLLNQGARLDLGSTSKLRTLITYLEQVAALHQRWSPLGGEGTGHPAHPR
jgi:hypothetical protein